MQRRVGIRAAHAFDERGRDIVMAVAAFIVSQSPGTGRPLDFRKRHFRVRRKSGRSLLEHIQREPRIAVGLQREFTEHLRRHGKFLFPQAALRIRHRILQNPSNGRRRQCFQTNQTQAGQKRLLHLKKRIFRSGTDQRNGAVFHIGQQ